MQKGAALELSGSLDAGGYSRLGLNSTVVATKDDSALTPIYDSFI
jgi:hypothetical protein